MLQPSLELKGQSAWRHPIYVGSGLLADTALWAHLIGKYNKIALVSDSVVGPHWLAPFRKILGPRVAVETLIPAGESSKNREQKTAIETAWLKAGLGRDGLAIAVGGGVVGDLAGFTAATYLRGIPVVQVPTSVVAMVDSSIGGKTGIDVPEGKNLIGAFHPPLAIVADLAVLDTLPDSELCHGMAEVIKHALIADASLLSLLRDNWPLLQRRDRALWAKVVETNVRIKGYVVMADEKEGGMRQILNAGHTVGHALEQLCNYQLPHGQGVALGTLAELHMAIAVRNFPSAQIAQIADALRLVGLPTTIRDARISVDAVLKAMETDKKVRGGKIFFALPNRLGGYDPDPSHGYAVPVDLPLVREAVAKILG